MPNNMMQNMQQMGMQGMDQMMPWGNGNGGYPPPLPDIRIFVVRYEFSSYYIIFSS